MIDDASAFVFSNTAWNTFIGCTTQHSVGTRIYQSEMWKLLEAEKTALCTYSYEAKSVKARQSLKHSEIHFDSAPFVLANSNEYLVGIIQLFSLLLPLERLLYYCTRGV